MKKLLFMAAAIAAFTFVSCGNKTGNNGTGSDSASDSLEAVTSTAVQAADDAINQLTANLDAKDASAFKTSLDDVKAKIADLLNTNPELAKSYVEKLQEFLNTNADKIKSTVGTNAAVATAVSALTTTSADDVVSSLKSAVTSVGNNAASQVDAAAEAVKNAPDAAKQAAEAAANQAVDNAKAKAAEKTNEAVESAKKKTNDAIDKGVSDAKKKLGL